VSAAQILTAAQMRAAEQALFDAGTSVGELMEIAAGGAGFNRPSREVVEEYIQSQKRRFG